MKPMSYNPQQGFPSEQPYRDYDHPPSRYDISSGDAGYPEPKYRSYDSSSPFENSMPPYEQQPWNPYNQPLSPSNSHGYDPHSPYGDGSDSVYSPPLRYDEPPPQQGFDGRPRYGKPAGAVRYEDPSPPAPEPSYQDSHLSAYASAGRSSDHAGQRPAYSQGPLPQQKSYKAQQYEPTPANSESGPTPPPKEAPSPSIVDAPKPLPARDEEPDDPAMRPQSVLTRVKMFENKRSVSVDRARDAGEPSGNKVGCSLVVLKSPCGW